MYTTSLKKLIQDELEGLQSLLAEVQVELGLSDITGEREIALLASSVSSFQQQAGRIA